MFNNNFGLLAIVMTVTQLWVASSVTAQNVVAGTASYYHESLEGNTTANGEIYRQAKLTAAHKSLPFDSWVLLSDRTGHTVVVRVNDRLPGNSSRLIDLSTKAAHQLDMLRIGIKRVKMQVISVEEAWRWYFDNGFINTYVAWR